MSNTFTLPITKKLTDYSDLTSSNGGRLDAGFFCFYLSDFTKCTSSVSFEDFFDAEKLIPYIMANGGQRIQTFENKTLREDFISKKNEYEYDFYGPEPDDIYHIFLYKKNVIHIWSDSSTNYKITIYFPTGEKSIEEELSSFVKEGSSTNVFMVSQVNGSLKFLKCEINFPQNFDLCINYGDKFPAISNKILESLGESESGLYMFHGTMGSGKTTYLRYLASSLRKDVIFLPTTLVGEIASPTLFSLLTKKKNCVLILEDAEKAITKRDSSHDPSLVSTLLNMTDGILGDVLKLNVIVTYNCGRQDIDPALLRKGRLKAEYFFGPLSVENANKLAKHIGIDAVFTEPTTLADIYNAKADKDLIGNVKEHFEVESPRIGFV